MPFQTRTVTVIIPSYNDASTIARVISDLHELRAPEDSSMALVDDIIVCNNGSTDGTAEEAKRAGAFVCSEFRRGYGFACLRAMKMLTRTGVPSPDYVVFIDGDNTVKAAGLPRLLSELSSGYDLVVGSRANGIKTSKSDASGGRQRLGSWVGRSLIDVIWKQRVTDLGPFRAIRYCALVQLGMCDKRFGWTLEMQIKAIQAGMAYREVAVNEFLNVSRPKISSSLSGMKEAITVCSKVFLLYWQETRFVNSYN